MGLLLKPPYCVTALRYSPRCHVMLPTMTAESIITSDGRTVIVPVSFFPDIKLMPVKEREKWMVLDLLKAA